MKPEPPLAPGTDLVEFLLSLPPELRAAALARLGIEEGETLDRAWPAWAHDGQAPPPGAWRTWVLKAGRGFGKTLAGAKWVTSLIAASSSPSRVREGAGGGPLHIALVGATLEDARRVMVEGRSGLIEIADAWVTGWSPSLGRLTFRTGAVATLFSGATPALLRGPEHHFAWCDELAKWEKPQETWDMLQLGLRLGDHPRALVTTTPRSGPVLAGIMIQPDTITTGGPTRANPHTSRAWQRSVHALYAGTRLGRQELDGELLPEAGALWSVELLERCRHNQKPSPLMGEGWVGVDSPERQSVSRSPPLPMSRFGSSHDPKPCPGDMATCSSLPILGRIHPPIRQNHHRRRSAHRRRHLRHRRLREGSRGHRPRPRRSQRHRRQPRNLVPRRRGCGADSQPNPAPACGIERAFGPVRGTRLLSRWRLAGTRAG